MREIKFRTFDLVTKKYTDLEYIDAFGNVYHEEKYDGVYPVENETILEQFTGLHDKNGKEIFEGDILHGREEGDGETTAWTEVYFQIIYDEKIAGFIARETKITNSSWDEQICELNTEYEVIGNIHENPELLNV